MKRKHKLTLSIVSLIISAAFTIVSVFAWVFFTAKSNDLFIYVGNIDLSCEVYVAVDYLNAEGLEEADGIPDITQFPPPSDMLRHEILSSYYLTMAKAKEANKDIEEDDNEAFRNIYAGRQLLYKIVIVNKSTGNNNALVSVSFSNMTAYFQEAVERYLDNGSPQTPGTMFDDLFDVNSARLLFNIRPLQAVVYQDVNKTNRYNDRLTVQPQENQFLEGSYLPLWEYSRGYDEGEFFIKKVKVDYNCLVEIDYALSCDFFTQELNAYSASAEELFYEKYSWKTGYTEAQIKAAISHIASLEALHVFQDSEGAITRKLDLTFNSIIIKGEQRP